MQCLYLLPVEYHSSYHHCIRSSEGLLWGAEPRFEPGLVVRKRTRYYLSHAATNLSHAAPNFVIMITFACVSVSAIISCRPRGMLGCEYNCEVCCITVQRRSILSSSSLLYVREESDVHTYTCNNHRLRSCYPDVIMWGLGTGCRPPPPSSTVGKTGRNHLNEEINPLLPTGIDERYCQTISNLEHAALLRQCELPL